MKLLYIIGNIINKAGVERIMTQKINYLAKAGHIVSLITTDQDNQPFSFPISKKVSYYAVNTPIPSRTDYSFSRWLLSYFKARSKYIKTLDKILETIQPDILICTTYAFDVIDLLNKLCHKHHSLLIIESHIQYINVFMGPRLAYSPILSLYAKIHDWIILKHIRRASMLVCLTHDDMKAWNSLHVYNTCVIPNMVTIQPIDSIDYTAKRIIAVGRYSEQKGYDLLIKAWGKIAPNHTDWNLFIFGNEDRTPYEELTVSEKCKNTCHCMPVAEDIAFEYRKSSIFVMSSRYEGMPLALLEAMSSGLACVSFRCPNGPSDIINDGIDGFLAKNGDIDDLSSKIEKLICNESLRREIGMRARDSIKRYSPKAIMQENIKLYEKILNRKS